MISVMVISLAPTRCDVLYTTSPFISTIFPPTYLPTYLPPAAAAGVGAAAVLDSPLALSYNYSAATPPASRSLRLPLPRRLLNNRSLISEMNSSLRTFITASQGGDGKHVATHYSKWRGCITRRCDTKGSKVWVGCLRGCFTLGSS